MIGHSAISFALLGYDGRATDAFVATRAGLVHEAEHHYPVRRAVVDAVPDGLIPLRAADVAGVAASWRSSLATH